MPSPVRVRIAPSPTGDPHVGTAYIALFNYVFARKHGGKFLLRIEDTDRTRSTLDSEAAILRSLRWLGLEWDEGPDVGGPHGPYRQSERQTIYREHADRLRASGHAYVCDCTPDRLEALRTRQRAESRPPGYDGRCRERGLEPGPGRVVRFAMPREGATVVSDQLRGEVSYESASLDDQVLMKSDGFPTYHLANVVDDRLMGITHVIRAEEWLPSTPKHVLLYRAFGWEAPAWVHMPLLRNTDKSKISKRKNPVSLDYYRETGILPEALRNFLALMGFSLGGDREKFTLAEMIEAFDWSRVHVGGPVFDLDKLSWLNGMYLRELGPAEVLARLRAWRLSDEYLLKIIPLVGERMRRLDEFVPLADFFLCGDLDHAAISREMVPKGRAPAETAKTLEQFADELDEHRPFEAAPLEALARAFCEKAGWKSKELFMAVRVAVTGRTASPPLFVTMEAVGRELCRRRLRRAIEALRAVRA
ncbi:MAG: glutamate--tRNA ligase [Myxococcota bacterium]